MRVSSLVSQFVRHPSVYNLIQTLNGERIFRQTLVDKYIKPRNGDAILDIGCGTGGYIRYLKHFDVEYYGFDGSPEYIKFAQTRYAAYPKFHFCCQKLEQASLTELPKFDIVIAMGVQHHLTDDEVMCLLELSRAALKDDGRLVTMDPCLFNDMNLIEWLMVKYDRGRYIRTQKEFESIIDRVFPFRRSFVDVLGKYPERAFVSECRLQRSLH
jgi:cyclopropane fatty-acyl-phospholipid synthase-like methyltransferase